MNRMKLIWLSVLLSVCYTVFAQHRALGTDSDFAEYAKELKNKGNECYMLSNRTGIRQVVDEYEAALTKRKAADMLSTEQEEIFRQDILKLNGDYHYENSDVDSSSYGLAERYFKEYRDYWQDHQGTYVAGQGLYTAHLELSQLYYKRGRYEEALKEMMAAKPDFDIYAEDENEPFDKLSQYAMCLARTGQYGEALRQVEEVLEYYENTSSERYGEALRKKAKILMLQEEQGAGKGRAEALECYMAYFALKKNDALERFVGMNSKEREQYWMRIRPFVTDCYRTEDADAGFLYDVTLFAKALLLQLDSAGGGRQAIHATWQMVQEALKPDACAIEFIQYEKYGEQQMGALVLKKTGAPVFVAMASPDSVLNYRLGYYSVQERLAKTNNGDAINRVYNDSVGIFRLVWNAELIDAVGTARKVFFAPDGYMHRIAVEYMLPKEASSWEMYRLTSTRRLLQHQLSNAGSKALIVGGVNFAGSQNQEVGANDEKAYRNMKRLRFDTLKTSLQEVEQIRAERNQSLDILLTADKATESAFRRLCSEFPIVHVSSHGKFASTQIPFGTDLKPCLGDESLSESVIVLAGVNTSLANDNFNPAARHDGILSAKEMSSLDMRNTQLVVLACCETGLGQITSEGVYGIQRGLKNAGAGAVVLSLWEATDDTTTAFMTAFHRRIAEGRSIAQAFRETRLQDFLTSDDDSVNNPFYRNVFVLIDAID